MNAEQQKDQLIVNDRKVVCVGDEKNGHPKVYLYIKENVIECPYCSKQIIYEQE